MLKIEGQKWLHQLRLKWILLYVLKEVLANLTFTLVLTVLAVHFLAFSWLVFLPISLLLAGIQLAYRPFWKISEKEIARHLNAQYPELEESMELFLKPHPETTFLERLQLEKLSAKLPLKGSLTVLIGKIGLNLIRLACSIGFWYYMGKVSFHNDGHNTLGKFARPAVMKENILPQISTYKITITPPAYTKRESRTQQQFSIKAETRAKLNWHLVTNKPVRQLKMVFNEKEVYQLEPVNQKATEWQFTKELHQPGFYQLILDGQKSDLYQLAIIPDLPVQIRVIRPQPRTVIDIGQPQKVGLQVNLTDDYGIKDAFIALTMASGKGEGVSFTEKKLQFNQRFSNQQNMKLDQMLDLAGLGMKPGDELYFFVQAVDNLGQVSRSDVYFVSIVDPAELLSMAGMTNGVNLVPEYFRSQRQLIIDTEKLIKEQAGLSTAEFKDRSNALGIDQKLLRLRYGKFLGEEAETEIGGDHDHDHDDGHDHGNEGEVKFGDVQALMDQYAHKHDIAEDATFFEPELKAQLKAVLTEMWSAELQLRTYKPQSALPFEYKALRLLKDLQQKSRVYVAKTTVKTTALKPEKRLSGELGKIISPWQQADFERKDEAKAQLKALLSVLDDKKTGQAFTPAAHQLLQEAERQLITAAANQPGTYLPALKSLRKMATGPKAMPKDIELVQRALQKIVGKENDLPNAPVAGANQSLSKTYFDYLKKQQN